MTTDITPPSHAGVSAAAKKARTASRNARSWSLRDRSMSVASDCSSIVGVASAVANNYRRRYQGMEIVSEFCQ